MIRHAVFFSCFLLVLVLNGAAFAERAAERVILASKVLGEDRPLNIVLPEGYSPGESYPVVYALDGGKKYLPTVAGRMQTAYPGLIVVGIENVDRSRDMFPEPLEERDNRGGGGDKFLSFITIELIPHIEKKYSTDGFRVLSGQSNSGFFVLYAMTKAPDAFDAWLASSPMIGWDWDLIRSGSRALLESRESFPKALYMNRGESDYDNTVDFLPRYVALLKEISPGDFHWTHEVVRGEDHVPESSYGKGVAFIFNR